MKLSTLLLLTACSGGPPPAPIVEAGPTLNKPPLDDREYRLVKLDNGLKVLLISDSDTDTAAAALTVGVGQFQDPSDREGLAHFLEHMLFMGTDRYPGVDDYKDYISNHGGGSNAGTGQERTNYYFTIEQAYLDGALDRFARFFVAPVLDPEQVDRERNAVESEYRLKIRDEARRIREIRRATSNQAHGFAKFSVGNLDTLADRGEEDLVWDDLKTFYEAEYSASRMTLSVIGREDLDTLEQWVRERFSEVPTNNTPPPVSTVPIYTEDQQGVWVHWAPITDKRELRIELPMPTWTEHFKQHPTSVITSMLGQEGEGSLHAILTERGWINSLMSGTAGADDHTLLTVTTALTEEGYQNIDEIVSLHFQYIRLIQQTEDLSPWWNEQRALSELNFNFAESPTPQSAVNSATYNLLTYPEQNVLDAWAAWDQYDPALQRTFLADLVPDNSRIFVAGPDLETDQLEPLYQVGWSMRPIDDETKRAWQDAPIDPGLTLPALNPYIAEDIALKDVEGEVGMPTLILDEDGLDVWHLQDPSFGVPRATIDVNLIDPAMGGDRQARLKATLLAAVLRDAMNTDLDQFRTAGMSVQLYRGGEGFGIQIRGYDDKQPAALERVLDVLAERPIDPERVTLIRDDIVRRWRNTAQDRPNTQAGRALSWTLDPSGDPLLESVDAMASISPEALQAFSDTLFQSLSAEVLVHGNHTAAEATQLAQTIRDTIADGVPPADRTTAETRKLPQAADLRLDIRADHDDSAIRLYYQGEEATIEEQARFLMLANLMETPFFSTLRTEKQLGYIAFAAYSRRDHLPGLQMGIQSSKADAQTLLQEIDTFIADFETELTEMTPEIFQDNQQALITNLTEPPNDLYDLNGNLSNDLSLGMTSFDRKAQLAQAIQPLTREDVLAFYQERVRSENARRLAIRVIGHTHGSIAFEDPGKDSVHALTQTLEERVTRPRE
jgi:secreted Zn-dependent insulinase-like peptidase